MTRVHHMCVYLYSATFDPPEVPTFGYVLLLLLLWLECGLLDFFSIICTKVCISTITGGYSYLCRCGLDWALL